MVRSKSPSKKLSIDKQIEMVKKLSDDKAEKEIYNLSSKILTFTDNYFRNYEFSEEFPHNTFNILKGTFSWSTPDKYLMDQIENFVEDDKVLEIGAGLGLWSRLMQLRGIDCVATSKFGSFYDEKQTEKYEWTNIEDLDYEKALKKYKDREVIFLSWPLGILDDVLKIYKGKKIILVIEPDGATDMIQHHLKDKKFNYKIYKTIHAPNYLGTNNFMYLLNRKDLKIKSVPHIWHITNYDELIEHAIKFLQGKLNKTPTHNGPIEEEKHHIRNKLIKMCEIGLVTTDSQPFLMTKEYRQRPFVQFYIEKKKFKKFTDVLLKIDNHLFVYNYTDGRFFYVKDDFFKYSEIEFPLSEDKIKGKYVPSFTTSIKFDSIMDDSTDIYGRFDEYLCENYYTIVVFSLDFNNKMFDEIVNTYSSI